MSRKKPKHRQAVPAEILAEGSDAVVAESTPDAAPEEVIAAPVEASSPEAEPATKNVQKQKNQKNQKKARRPGAASASEGDADELAVSTEARVASDDDATEADKLAGSEAAPAGAEAAEEAAHDELAAAGEDAADELVASDDEVADASGDDAACGDLAVSAPTELAMRDSELPDDLVASAPEVDTVDGDDVVGDPITDEAGVEAALLPGSLSAVQLRHLIEALIFATDKPVTLQRLRQLTRVSDVTRIEAALAELHEDYKDRGIALTVVSGGYQFRTNTSFSSWVQQLIAGRPVRLSRAQLETLAIVAYRQPITRPEIDEIRGVDSSATLRLLLDRSLIRVLGKREEVGRPTLFGTTKEFLDFFSLGDLRELPTLREYSELTAESRQVMSDRLGVPLDENGDLVEPEMEAIDLGASDLPADSASIVDSILAEHAASEAAVEGRTYDASAMAEAAMSGGHANSFSSAFAETELDDEDDAAAMSLSGNASGFQAPRSEARSYIDAIRSSTLVSDSNADAPVELADLADLDDVDDVDVRADAVIEAAGDGVTESGEPPASELAPDDASADVVAASRVPAGLDDVELGADELHAGAAPEMASIAVTTASESHVELAPDEALESADLEAAGDESSDAGERADIELAPDEAPASAALEASESHADPGGIGPDRGDVELAPDEGHQATELAEATEVTPIDAAGVEHGRLPDPELETVNIADLEHHETANIDLGHVGDSEDAELEAEAALEAATAARAAQLEAAEQRDVAGLPEVDAAEAEPNAVSPGHEPESNAVSPDDDDDDADDTDDASDSDTDDTDGGN